MSFSASGSMSASLDISGAVGAAAGVAGAVTGAVDAFGNAVGDVVGDIADTLLGGFKLFEAMNPFVFVSFDYNPSKFVVKRKSMSFQVSSTTEGGGGNRQETIGTYATQIDFTALLTEEDSGSLSGALLDAATGQGVVNRATTMLNWATTGTQPSLLGLLGAEIFGAAASAMGIEPQQPNALPLLVLQWGDPMRGHLMLGCLQDVIVTYKRFSSMGNPIRAEVSASFFERRNPLLSALTNPTSGGVPGRKAHTVTQGENLQSVAVANYGRPGSWRAVAETNGIDDPLRVRPGKKLLLPPDDLARS